MVADLELICYQRKYRRIEHHILPPKEHHVAKVVAILIRCPTLIRWFVAILCSVKNVALYQFEQWNESSKEYFNTFTFYNHIPSILVFSVWIWVILLRNFNFQFYIFSNTRKPLRKTKFWLIAAATVFWHHYPSEKNCLLFCRFRQKKIPVLELFKKVLCFFICWKILYLFERPLASDFLKSNWLSFWILI